jgi:hypothetical protein
VQHASSKGAFAAVASVLVLALAAVGVYLATHRPAPQIAGVVETATRVAPGAPGGSVTPEDAPPSAVPSTTPGVAPAVIATVGPKGPRYVRPQPIVQPLPPVAPPPPPVKRDTAGF